MSASGSPQFEGFELLGHQDHAAGMTYLQAGFPAGPVRIAYKDLRLPVVCQRAAVEPQSAGGALELIDFGDMNSGWIFCFGRQPDGTWGVLLSAQLRQQVRLAEAPRAMTPIIFPGILRFNGPDDFSLTPDPRFYPDLDVPGGRA